MVSNSRAGIAVINALERGGGAEVVYQATVAHYARTRKVVTVSGQGSSREGHVEVPDKKTNPVQGTLLTPFTAPKVVWRILRAIRSVRADTVLVHNLWPNLGTEGAFALRIARRLWGTRVVLVAHDYQYVCATSMLFDHRRGVHCEDCLGRRLKLAPFFRRCDKGGVASSLIKAVRGFLGSIVIGKGSLFDKIVAPSATMRGKLLAEGYRSESVVVARNGIPAVEPSNVPREDVILVAGRLEPEKGADMLPAIFQGISRIKPSVRFVVLGEGSRMEALRQSIQERGLSDVVEIPGSVPRHEVLRRARGAKVFLFPSRWIENCPLGLVEAVLAGLHPIAGRMGGQAEILEGVGAGTLVDEPTPERYADACLEALGAFESPASAHVRALARQRAGNLYAESAFFSVLDEAVDGVDEKSVRV